MSAQDNKKATNNKQPNAMSRRNFMKNLGLTVGGIAIGGGIVGAIAGNKQEKEVKAPEATPHYDHAMMFFTDPKDFKVIEAAAERIYPKTEEGPGAKDLGVGYYIDHQLAGAWGNNVKEYHVGPFFETEAVPEQGYQTRMRRNEVFLSGIEALRNEAQKRHKKAFDELAANEQDAILKDFEANKVTIHGTAKASYFFGLLKQATIEGAYADPMYGGNKNMEGWKMKNFPGANTVQYPKIIEKNEFVKLEPQSLKDHMGH